MESRRATPSTWRGHAVSILTGLPVLPIEETEILAGTEVRTGAWLLRPNHPGRGTADGASSPKTLDVGIPYPPCDRLETTDLGDVGREP